MSSSFLPSVVDEAIADLQRRSKSNIYKTDPVAWASDVLGKRLWSKQMEIAYSVRDNVRTAVRSCNNAGKALRTNTRLPTPTGWTTMGEVQVGDYLLDESGVPTKVTYKSPVFHKSTYRITFNDGSWIDTCDEHQWSTIDFAAVRRNSYVPVEDYRNLWGISKVRTTKDIFNSVATHHKTPKKNHYIPISRSLDLPEADLSVDPYILGAWLGDGSSRDPSMTIGSGSAYVITEFAARGVTLVNGRDKRGITWAFTRQGYREAFRNLDVLDNKHIPMPYLRASVVQRKELLRGIMDTDGFHIRNSTCGIDLMNSRLAHDTVELVRSLGLKASITPARTYLNGRDVGTRCRIVFNSDFNPFTVGQHKAEKWHIASNAHGRKTVRLISDVKQIETAPTQCVAVDSPRSLYLATDWFIPTHNTSAAGVIGAWWLAVHDPYDTVVMCTAPGFAQIKTNLFFEFQKNYRLALDRGNPLPGRIVVSNQEASWKYNGIDIAFGRRPPDRDIISYFQGVHRANQLIIIDEAGGLPRDMFTAAERVITTGNAKILAIGNPDHLGSEFHKMFGPESDWSQIHISGYDTPNFTREAFPDELRGFMLQPAWVERQKRVWGEKDPRYLVSILGEFPDADDTTFFSQNIINKAIDTEFDDDSDYTPEMGVDLARYGEDQSVIYTYANGRLRKHSSWAKTGAIESANRVHQTAIDLGARIVKVDAGGLGGPIIDQLIAMCGHFYTVVGINGGGATPDPRRWLNARAASFDRLREMMALGEIDIDPDDEQLIQEMVDLNYEFTDKGSIKIESKKDMRSRGGKSPDFLDAAVYATMDVSELVSGPLAGYKPGDKFRTSPADVIGADNMPKYLSLMREW
jgi:hypothetical protein